LARLTFSVNNAGAWQTEFFVKQKRENWSFQVDVCFYGTLNFTKAIIDHMISRQNSSIINVASGMPHALESLISHLFWSEGGRCSFFEGAG